MELYIWSNGVIYRVQWSYIYGPVELYIGSSGVIYRVQWSYI